MKKKILIWSGSILGLLAAIIGLLLVAARVYSLETIAIPRQVENVEEMEAFFDELTETNNPPGINVVILKDGEFVYNKGFGTADGINNRPMTSDSIHGWFSITKIPTAIAVLQLHDQGLLDIDDPVSMHLDFFDVTYLSANSPEITIRQLLNHSSGLPNNLPDVALWIHGEDVSPYDQTEFLKSKFDKFSTVIFEPGDHAEYTNFGYSVLGSVVEEVSGVPYEDYVRQNILDPLEMDSTDFIYRDDMRADAAVASHEIGSELTLFIPFIFPGIVSNWDFENHLIWFSKFYAHSSPPTGLIGPADEMSHIMLAMMNDGK